MVQISPVPVTLVKAPADAEADEQQDD
jgi:hypothetical protein